MAEIEINRVANNKSLFNFCVFGIFLRYEQFGIKGCNRHQMVGTDRDSIKVGIARLDNDSGPPADT